MGEKKLYSDNYKAWIIWALIAVVTIFLCIVLLNVVFTNDILCNLGTFGDSFGAMNALFSGLAFAILIVATLMQFNEIKETRKQANNNYKALLEQIELLEKSNRSSVVVNLFNEFRGEKWTDIRNQMYEEKKKGEILEFDKVREYSHFLNHFGFLLEHGYVDVRPLYETFGRGVMEFWRLYEKDIKKQRDHTNSIEKYRPYQYHLEYLDWQLRKYYNEGRNDIEELLKKINDWDKKH
ncbi:hypothetical protein GTQ34_16100 [Muricauda sp. JGD-17]|uniref:DUF4760 domain-containing protein n=1 Tax=Flagellimonas ochracea TaxID=2696472 RepID=A0A964TFB3_9FLAO|nr:DUF898 domain-containing protein [Allomuricauda ochracea]NAY93434.1 hypothetical protein [Allomuricauda ochracea]